MTTSWPLAATTKPRARMPYPEDPDGPRWGPPAEIVTELPAVAAGDPCPWDGRPIPANHVVDAGLGYCDTVCADLHRHSCPSCGGDLRQPAQAPAEVACDQHPRWRGPR